jgi:hypothetical protein
VRRTALSLALAVIAGPVHGHAFDAGADAYGQFVEGAAVMLTFPGIVLPLLALGVLLSLWREDGLPNVWPVFLVAQLAGVFGAALIGPVVALIFMALGIVIAAMAALAPSVPKMAAYGFAGLAGVCAMLTAFEGHGLFELPVFTHLGLLFGANLATALAAGIARLALTRVEAGWMRIAWRVAASWIGAILMLTLAFEVAGPIS